MHTTKITMRYNSYAKWGSNPVALAHYYSIPNSCFMFKFMFALTA